MVVSKMVAEENVDDLTYQHVYITYSKDCDTRLLGTSGGFITELNRFLFEENKIKSSIAYFFSGKELFKPLIIYKSQDIVQAGSIYHEVDLLNFLKSNIDKIKSPIFITCLPCQCNPIEILMKSHNIEYVLVSLICSQQCEKNATYDFLKRQRIDINNVMDLRYRGNGWPSGMQVIEKDGEKHFFHNSKSEWNMYFHSTIYTMKRCFYCNKTFGTNADFSVSDPWIPRYSKKDAIGHSIVGVTSSQANQILKKMEKSNRIKILEEISLNEFFNSQLGAVQKKKAYKNFYFYKKAIAFFRTSTYKNFFNKYPKLHNTINKFCRYFFVKMV